MKKETSKGIILIATGHYNYGKMAYNLAVSIKAKDPALQVALVYNPSALLHLTEKQIGIFDFKTATDKKWNELKLNANQYTPFERTLRLDVDMLWIKDNPAEVFDILDNVEFTCVNEGYYNMETGEDKTNPKYQVGIAPALYKKYKFTHDKFWVCRGEFILWKKSKLTDKIFADAYKVYTDKTLVEGNNPIMKNIRFAGVLPEEFAIDSSLCKNKIDPHEFKWQPAYWPHLFGTLIPNLWELNKKYYAFSFGGALSLPSYKKMYDLIMQAACQKLNVQHLYKLQSKKDYDPTRKKF